jgi:hypothetical protein
MNPITTDRDHRSARETLDIVEEADQASFPATGAPARTVVTGIAARDTTDSFRLRPIMKQGTASSIPETWIHYSSIEEARRDAKRMYHNDRVLRVMLVVDGGGPFVEWIER